MGDKDMLDNREWLTAYEARDLLGVHLNTLYRFCRQNRIPAKKIGRQWRLNKKALLDLLGLST